MLSSSVIVFREMLEMCLIVGMVFAALDHLPNKKHILFSGLIIGIILSIVIAISFYKASSFFYGNGQEFLNMAILTASITCIALTILWIDSHVKSLREKVKATSLQNGTWPVITVIALAISREGAELTLFIHGIAASGTTTADLLTGIILGVSLGIALGVLLYVGFVKIPSHYFFKAINTMLILLSATMAAELANYFTATDLITIGSENLWNSAWLISDTSLHGRFLHAIVGYSSKPTKLQAAFYVTVLIIMVAILKIKRNKKQNA